MCCIIVIRYMITTSYEYFQSCCVLLSSIYVGASTFLCLYIHLNNTVICLLPDFSENNNFCSKNMTLTRVFCLFVCLGVFFLGGGGVFRPPSTVMTPGHPGSRVNISANEKVLFINCCKINDVQCNDC